MLGYETQPDGVGFALDLSRAYAAADLESFVRSFAWSVSAPSQSARLRLIDRVRFAGLPGTIDECFICPREPNLQAGSATWRGEHGTVTMRFDRDQFEPGVESLAVQTHFGEAITVCRLRLRALNASINREDAFVFEARLLG